MNIILFQQITIDSFIFKYEGEGDIWQFFYFNWKTMVSKPSDTRTTDCHILYIFILFDSSRQ